MTEVQPAVPRAPLRIRRLRHVTVAASLIAATLVLGPPLPLAARVDVHVAFDKDFDFASARTWSWRAESPGDVLMARTRNDDPAAMKGRAEPIILDAVATELASRGLTAAAPPTDLTVTYYLLLTTSLNAHTLGQFLPPTTAWGVPPFAAATQSLKLQNHGALVIDISASDAVVWRGVAQDDIKMDADEKRRISVIRQAANALLRRYPPR